MIHLPLPTTPVRPNTLPFKDGYKQFEPNPGDRDYSAQTAVADKIQHMGYNRAHWKNAPLVLPALTDDFWSFLITFHREEDAIEFAARFPKWVKVRQHGPRIDFQIQWILKDTISKTMGEANEQGTKRARRFHEGLVTYLDTLAGQPATTHQLLCP